MASLKELIVVFKNETEAIIEYLKQEEFEKLDECFEARQKTIDEINKISFSNTEFDEICKMLDIINIQKECENLLNSKMLGIKDEIKKLSLTKGMNRKYTEISYVDSIYFNKKI